MSQVEFDVLVPCQECGSGVNEACKFESEPNEAKVHFVRRIDRLLKERGATWEELNRAIENGTELKHN